MLTASKPLIYLRFLKSYNYTPTIGEFLKDSPIFYCSFVNFMILLHGKVQQLSFGCLYVKP